MDIIEIFNICIDRLNNGEDVDSILADYPTVANHLRPMLVTGLLFPRSRFASAEVDLARQAIEPTVHQTVNTVFGTGLSGTFWGIIIVIGLVGAGLLFMALHPSVPDESVSVYVMGETSSTDNQIVIPKAISPTVTEIDPRATSIIDATAELTLSPTSTNTLVPMTETPELIQVASESRDAILVIQGPVQAITVDTITIYDQPIQVKPDDPIMSVIQIGDVVRIEGKQEIDDSIVLVNIEFINVLVVISDGQMWRGDDCDSPPPDWAEGKADEWMIMCIAPQFNPPPSNQNNSNNSNSGQNNSNNHPQNNNNHHHDDDD